MRVTEHDLTITLEDGERVSGSLLMPERRGADGVTLLALAHGAGNDMRNPFLSAVCEGLAEAGIAALKFNFPYKEKGRKAPDSTLKLESSWRAVLDWTRNDAPVAIDRVFIGGKSLGGRMASRVVAQGQTVDGLVFLGYPLHPAGWPERQRTEHFPAIEVPTLFVQGTRDSLCDLALLRQALTLLKGAAALHLIEGGDHSFNLPKRMGVSQSEVWKEIVAAVVSWIGAPVDGGSR